MTDINDEVRPRNPVFLGEGRPTDNDREQFVKDINEMNKVVFEELAKGDNACPYLGCQCEPNQVTKDAIEEARNRNDTR